MLIARIKDVCFPNGGVFSVTNENAEWPASRYGRIQIRQRERLESTACECYGVIRAHVARFGL